MIEPSEQYTKGLYLQSQLQYLKRQHITSPPFENSGYNQPHFPSSARRLYNKLTSSPSEQSKINFEYYNTWIYYYSSTHLLILPKSQSTPVGTASRQNVQLKSNTDSLRTNAVFPAFRFYSPDVHAYLSKSNSSREIVARERNPFSQIIEWEWIPQPRYNGVYLRNRVSKHFFCFNKNGRPAVRKSLNRERCLLHGYIRFYSGTKRPKSAKRRSQARNTFVNAFKESNLQVPYKTMSNRNATNNSIPTGYPRRNKRSLRRIGGFADFLLPAVIHLTSRQQTPEWRVGFCLNGNAFVNRKPFAEKCPSYTLPVRWNLLYMCPPVPRYCRIPECQSENTVYGENIGCPYTCRASIFCGDTSDRVNAVYT
ncbi:unnamed protein product [Rodentolepis nana]|uniref:Uncharacterized protein n=1 Tax=Rodentolepis nana TaxID=102285 RepID=A0A0R3TKY5_RODNA|nr:unnamed protein product [Rodentolepis nana]